MAVPQFSELRRMAEAFWAKAARESRVTRRLLRAFGCHDAFNAAAPLRVRTQVSMAGRGRASRPSVVTAMPLRHGLSGSL